MFLWKNSGIISAHRNQRKKYKEVGLPVKIPHPFTGHVTKRFLNDADGIYTLALEVDCLQEKYGVTDCVLKEHPFDKKMKR